MAWQLIYTSAERTLTPGQCGYGTVARSANLREALVQRLEQLSYYDLPAARNRTGPCPVIHACRVLDLRGSKYHLLSRIVDARLDFTHRTNHLAHHLVLSPGELADLPSPATLLRHWNGWKDLWSEGPRFLDESDWGNLGQLPRTVALPAANWARLTGDAGRAAALVDWPAPGGIQLVIRPDQEIVLLDLLAESLQLLDPENRSPGSRWQFTFTTLLQNRDDPADFHWRCSQESSDARFASPRPSGATPFTLAELPVPETPRATVARRGPVLRSGLASPSAAIPQQLLPSDASNVPLRLNRSKTQGDASPLGPAPETRPEPTRRQPAVAPRVFNRRVFIPLVALLTLAVVLLGGFYRPGWFLDRQTRPRTASATQSPVLPDSVPIVTPPPTEASPPSETPGATSSLPAVGSPDAAALLGSALDRIPTYLIHARTDTDAMELGPIPELEALLLRVFGKSQDLEAKSIRVLAQTGDIRPAIAPSASERPPEIMQFGEKKLYVGSPGASNRLAMLDCTEWVRDPQRPILLGGFRSADRGLTLVFQPATGGPGFDRFRLLMITGQPPKPIELPKGLLRSERTNLADTLDPELWARLPRLPVPPAAPYRFQLRTYAGSPATEVFETFSADYPVADGSELALDYHRRNLRALMEGLALSQERIQAEAEELKTKVEATIAKDLPLGTILGIRKSSKVGHLANLGEFAKHRGNQDFPDQDDFVEYLRALFAYLKMPARDLLGPPRRPTGKEIAKVHGLLAAELKEAPEVLAAIRPSYFTNRWAQFGTVDLLREFRDRGLNLSNQAVRLKSLLERIPPDLDATPRVSLNVVDSKGIRLFELVRFTDSAAKDTP